MNELLQRQVEEIRRNLNAITKKLKRTSRVGGRGASRMSSLLATVNVKLDDALDLELAPGDEEPEDNEAEG